MPTNWLSVSYLPTRTKNTIRATNAAAGYKDAELCKSPHAAKCNAVSPDHTRVII